MTSLKPPVGLFGGTFDPIHFGHLRLAQVLAEDLHLGEVRFIPAGLPPHRQTPSVEPEQRLEMVKLAIADNPLFKLDEREIWKTEPSYTVTTLETIRAEIGDQPLYLLMGADAFFGLPGWFQWQRLFDLAHIVVAHRPGTDMTRMMPADLRAEWQVRLSEDPISMRQEAYGRIIYHSLPPLDISASMIRNLLRSGASPRYLLPEQVLDYIQCNKIYG